VVTEAMAVGTPVIGSRCGGIAEQIVDGRSGLLFNPGDAAELAAALDRLLSDSSLHQNLASGGLNRVRDAFPLEGTYHAMAGLLNELTGSGLYAAPEKSSS
jgi:glycosyltransferase involved in cell wall biosynthesis